MADLEQEIAAFEDMRVALEADHSGEWVVVHGGELVGKYENFDAAAGEAIKMFGRGPYLIRQIGATPVVIPASAMFLFQHA